MTSCMVEKLADLQSILDAADALTRVMDEVISQERRFNPMVILELERHNWELCRTKNNIRSLNEEYGE